MGNKIQELKVPDSLCIEDEQKKLIRMAESVVKDNLQDHTPYGL